MIAAVRLVCLVYDKEIRVKLCRVVFCATVLCRGSSLELHRWGVSNLNRKEMMYAVPFP
jgi:hypothetical protein